MSLHSIDQGFFLHNIESGFSMGRAQAFDPTQLASLDLWLNADHGVYGGGSRQFTAATSESLSRASFTAVNLGVGDFSINCAFNRSTSGNQVIASKYQDANNYWRFEFTAANVLHFIAVIGGVTLIEVTGTTAITTAGWHTVALNVDRDATATTRIYLNGVNDTAGTPTVSVSTIDNTGAFALGESGAASLYWNGKLARFGVLKGDLLSTTEITWWHNFKNARLYGELGVAGTDGSGLTNYAFWVNLNEPSGNAIDAASTNDLTDNNTVTAADGPGEDIAADSIGTNHGTLINFPAGGVAWSSDKPTPMAAVLDGSLNFDGTDDYISPATFLSGTTYSVSAWIKTDSVVVSRVMASERSTSAANPIVFQLDQLNADARFLVRDDAGNIAAASKAGALTAGVWFHVVGTRNGNDVNVYVDAVAGTPASAAIGAITTNSFNIGALVNASTTRTSLFDGKIADLRIYNVVLSLSQVSELFAGDEATGATPVARWKLDDGPQTGLVDGDPVIDWRAYAGTHIGKQHLQATYAKRPLFRSAGINSKAAVDFDGTDDLLVNPTAYLTGTQGHVFVVERLDGTPDSYQTSLASADEATTNKYFSLFGRGNTANPHTYYSQNNGATSDDLEGSNTVSASTDYIVEWASDGLAVTAKLNGSAETLGVDGGANNGDWFSDTSDKDNIVLGAVKRTTEASFLNGKIRHILVFNEKLSDADALLVRQYLADDAGITL